MARVEQGYLNLLREEMEDAQRRLARADPEGVPVIQTQIREISRDILRNSANAEKTGDRFFSVFDGFEQGKANSR